MCRWFQRDNTAASLTRNSARIITAECRRRRCYRLYNTCDVGDYLSPISDMTSFHAEMCCHLVRHTAPARRLCRSLRQFLIYSTILFVFLEAAIYISAVYNVTVWIFKVSPKRNYGSKYFCIFGQGVIILRCPPANFKLNRAFGVIQGHSYWCRQKSRTGCRRKSTIMSTLDHSRSFILPSAADGQGVAYHHIILLALSVKFPKK